ncbi:transposase [Candidatus Hakubella thermalkaliphila]|uniref:transposase n=1 Tax=Candidatus Hakubella thermalkaliphila TaxID=2754717 RepID=UPI001593D688
MILNFWKHRICNAITEGKINKIKALRRRAFNYNNFQTLRLKILEQEEMTPSSPHQRV